MTKQFISDHTGAFGASATCIATTTSIFSVALPILHFVEVLVSIAVGLATLAWYAHKFRDAMKK